MPRLQTVTNLGPSPTVRYACELKKLELVGTYELILNFKIDVQ